MSNPNSGRRVGSASRQPPAATNPLAQLSRVDSLRAAHGATGSGGTTVVDVGTVDNTADSSGAPALAMQGPLNESSSSAVMMGHGAGAGLVRAADPSLRRRSDVLKRKDSRVGGGMSVSMDSAAVVDS
jgi:hypothetical protein